MVKNNEKLLTYRDVALLIGSSESAVRGKHCKSAYGYNPSFPEPIKLGPRTVRFKESEILDWIEAKQKEVRLISY